MLSLIRFFIQLCLLRARPQDLPASQALLGLDRSGQRGRRHAGQPDAGRPVAALLASLLDTAILGAFVWLLLGFRQTTPSAFCRPPRRRSASALIVAA